jgi:hypothetical protein
MKASARKERRENAANKLWLKYESERSGAWKIAENGSKQPKMAKWQHIKNWNIISENGYSMKRKISIKIKAQSIENKYRK